MSPTESKIKAFEAAWAGYVNALTRYETALREGKKGWALNNYRRAVKAWKAKLAALESN